MCRRAGSGIDVDSPKPAMLGMRRPRGVDLEQASAPRHPITGPARGPWLAGELVRPEARYGLRDGTGVPTKVFTTSGLASTCGTWQVLHW